jgi:hypothetical protein
VTDADVRGAFAEFGNVWGRLSPREQAEVLALLVARVDYDARAETVAVSFHPAGIRSLANQQQQQQQPEEAAA